MGISRRKSLLAVTLILCGSIVFAFADNKHKDKGKHSRRDDKATRVAVNVFINSDRDLIQHHYRQYRDSRNLPPGLAKRGNGLPPGIEKHLRKHGHLPPGLHKKIYPFPVVLEQSLPPLRPGLTRGLIGGMAVIMDDRTSVILDVFAVF